MPVLLFPQACGVFPTREEPVAKAISGTWKVTAIYVRFMESFGPDEFPRDTTRDYFRFDDSLTYHYRLQTIRWDSASQAAVPDTVTTLEIQPYSIHGHRAYAGRFQFWVDGDKLRMENQGIPNPDWTTGPGEQVADGERYTGTWPPPSWPWPPRDTSLDGFTEPR